MDDNGSVTVEEMQTRLKELRHYMPGGPRKVYQFAEYLSERLDQEVNPEGFYRASVLALVDLGRGVDPYTGNLIRNDLADSPELILTYIATRVPDIAKAIFPKDFAEGVKEALEHHRELARKYGKSADS